VKNWKQRTKEIDLANWAQALAPNWSGSGTGDLVSAEAFAHLINLVKLGGNNGTGYPLKHAYKLVANEAERRVGTGQNCIQCGVGGTKLTQ
jgi:hypothetical protein